MNKNKEKQKKHRKEFEVEQEAMQTFQNVDSLANAIAVTRESDSADGIRVFTKICHLGS